MSKLLVDEISDADNTGPVTVTDGLNVSSGNVGIGTTSPSFESGTGTGLEINNSSGNGAHVKLTDAASGSGGTNGFDLYAFNTSGYIENYEAGSIVFRNGGTERMRIDSSGNLLVGTTVVHGTNSKVSIKTEVDKSGIGITAYKSSNSNYYFMNFIANTTSVGDIYSNGSSTTYATSSDYRLKENVESLVGASERVNQLLPKRFNFINDETNTLVDGFLAHEVQSVVPEAILGTHNGMKDEEYEVTAAVLDDDGRVVTEAVMGTRSVPDMQGIDQSKLVPLLTAALQEALNKIEAMETRLAALEAN
jgi:hypothetical protein